MAAARRIAIVSALHEELHALQAVATIDRVERRAGRDIHLGRLDGHEVALVLSGVGKVAAATTAAVLLDGCAVDALLFTGVAGGLAAGVKVGDMVVATQTLQHDLDASPLFPRWEVPLTGRSRFDADPGWRQALLQGCSALQQAMARGQGGGASLASARQRLGLSALGAQAHQGLVISGDRFVATQAESETLRQLLPDALAVEMEGAALAQVCADFAHRPYALLRTISDRADDSAHVDFGRFIVELAATMSREIVRGALAHSPQPAPQPAPQSAPQSASAPAPQPAPPPGRPS